MRDLKDNNWFTLVELIVVITILAILSTIAFVSVQNYTKNSRDWVRISDVNAIKKNLELFITEKWFYPNPDNSVGMTYKWWLVWTQWTIWDTVIMNLGRINKKPTDPLVWNEYTYSITNFRNEYQIWTISEVGWFTYIEPSILTSKVYAASEKKATAIVTWTYNWKILKTSTGLVEYILALPSIISTNLNNSDITTIIDNKELVYNNYSNIPNSYKDSWYTMTGWFDFNLNSIVVYSWSIKSLDQEENKLIFISNLKNAYFGSILATDPTYTEIVNTNTGSNRVWSLKIANNFILYNVWWITWKQSEIIYRNCTLSDWKKISHGDSVTTYSEDYILFWAWYDCPDRSQERICNDWLLSWNDIYSHTICVKWDPTNCLATWSYVYKEHTYNIPAINHWATEANIISSDVSENNGIFNYTLSSITCNDWDLINPNENSTPVLANCNINYSKSDNTCVADTQTYTCTAKPETGTVWNSVSSYTQTWNGTARSPAADTTNYNATASTTACNYKCAINYTRNWTTCAPNTQTYTCAAKPATGTVWNSVSSYTQTWNGTTRTPANTTTSYNITASSTTCRYTCAANYYWNWSSCVAYTYSRAIGSRSACSKSCGWGVQTRSVTCKRNDGVTVADTYCVSKPAASISCNTQACWSCNATTWWTGSDRWATVDYQNTGISDQTGCYNRCINILNSIKNTWNHICVVRTKTWIWCYLYVDDSLQWALESGRYYRKITCTN